MEGLQIFKNEQFGQVRVVTKDNEPWFVGKDVAEILGYTNSRKALLDHVEQEDKFIGDGVTIRDSIGREQSPVVINESGLYSLILGSKLPTAKKFKKWVTSEVLPSIRKHGMYATDELLDNPDLLIAAATRLKEERQARLEAEKKVQVMKPKADFYDDVAGSKDAISIAEVAKVLGIRGLGRNNLFQLLRDKKILQANNQPYQSYVDRGYFRVLEQKWQTPEGVTKISIKTLVYQKGLDYIRKIVNE